MAKRAPSPKPPSEGTADLAAGTDEQDVLATTLAEADALRRRVALLEGTEQSLRTARWERQVLELRYAELETTVALMRASRWWTLGTRLSRLRTLIRRLMLGVTAWVMLRPGGRPHRILQSALGRLQSSGIAPLGDNRTRGTGVRYLFVDHTVACPTNTGVQRVTRGLANAMATSGGEVRFVKWSAAAKACVLLDSAERAQLARWNGPPISAREADIYRAPGALPRPLRPAAGDWLIVPEVTHITFQAQPVTSNLTRWARQAGLKIGFVFYDAIPLKRPEFAGLARAHAQYMRALRLADAVWPISRWSADELAAFWGVGRDADGGYLPIVRPIHLPAEFDRPRQTEVRRGEKLILSVGTLEPRKNQTTLLRAFQSIMAAQPDCGWRLILVGNLHPDVADEVQAATQPGATVEWLGHVTDEALSALYERCAFTIFPSVEEGYGLPILESVWLGKPCVCADFGAMAEIAAGGGCLTVDVRDEAILRSVLMQLMDEPERLDALAREALARPIGTWNDYLAQMIASLTGEAPQVYYWVDSTVSFPGNTGIQRIARQLARGLIDQGFRLVPVKWGGQGRPLHPVSDDELAHFARWNGPAVDRWSPWIEPSVHGGGGWFMMTELPLNLTPAEQGLVRDTAAAAGLNSAAVFYDTIPWKMRDHYPEVFSTAHRAYISELANYDRVFPISQYSRSEMMAVLAEEFEVPAGRLGHIVAHSLAGEFPERADEEGPPPRRSNGALDILCVGTIEPRKNHEALLDAFDMACRRSAAPLHLTLAGGSISFDQDLPRRVRARIAGDPRIDWVEQADDALINRLYAGCDFTVYPSVEEGFGLPILESLWHGRPVICADFGAMAEVARDGGCLMTDVRDPAALSDALVALASDAALRARLTAESGERRFKSWRDYAGEIAGGLGLWSFPEPDDVVSRREAMGLSQRPRLSVCISTYNRAEWLKSSLRNIAELYPEPVPSVEFVICDNASTDHTPEVVAPMLQRPDFVYRRNRANVGMLGNLRETAHAASGEHIWILGDDDLLRYGAVERVLNALQSVPDVALVYLNYAHSSVQDARTISDFRRFFAESTAIVPPEPDRVGPIREICARNENFFTAIYTLVFRRDHALAAYSQDTGERPFSTMLSCIPTTHYVLNHLMEETGVWIGDPQVVVNLNVSWMRYAPLWILERIPEVYEVARQKGVPAADIDRWRRHTLPSVQHYFAEIFSDDPLENAAYLSVPRLVRRFADLPEFTACLPSMIDIYARAHKAGHPAASAPPEAVFGPQ